MPGLGAVGEPYLRTVRQACTAALDNDPAFTELLNRLIVESDGLPPAELTAALPPIANAIANTSPGLSGWLSLVCGSWIEGGADPDPVGAVIVDRTARVANAAVLFADAWTAAGGGPLPDMEQDQPTAEILGVVTPELDDFDELAMLSWFTLPQHVQAACTVLQMGPRVRAGVTDRADQIQVATQAARHWEPTGFVEKLLRVLDDEPILVLHRELRRGWTVRISGIGDNFQLQTLLAGALVGRAGGLPGTPPDPRVLASFTDSDVADAPTVTAWWNLVDPRGEWIWNEGVPADIPLFDGTRVVVLDPLPYARSWNAGRQFPLMTAKLTVVTEHPPEQLSTWWPRLAPAQTLRQ